MLRRGQGGSQQDPWLATAFKLTQVLGPSPPNLDGYICCGIL